MKHSELEALKAENIRLIKALEEIENIAAWNDPAWRIASDALNADMVSFKVKDD
jgi:hypothetical protein